MNDKVCIVCKGQNSMAKGNLKEVKTKANLVFRAHEECIEGLYLLLLTRKERIEVAISTVKSCSELVKGLFLDGWFSEPRQLLEVVNKTKQKGYNFTKPTIANALRELVRRDSLQRIGKIGEYSYVQKRPPEGGP